MLADNNSQQNSQDNWKLIYDFVRSIPVSNEKPNKVSDFKSKMQDLAKFIVNREISKRH